MSSTTVTHVSESFIKPKYEVQEAKNKYYLGPPDLLRLSIHYIQKGLLFSKSSHLENSQTFNIDHFLESLKTSLSFTLVHFYPLAGQLVSQIDKTRNQTLVFVDCNKGPGARFIHAKLDLTISDILSPTDVPVVVNSLFDHDRAVNYDGHYLPLLSVQVTELINGVFIGLSMNHCLADGCSYWNFWNIWSKIHRSNCNELVAKLSDPSVHTRWFPDEYGLAIFLPFTQPEEIITRYQAPQLREKIFHFSSESIAKIKDTANEENINNISIRNISSFQALSALCWRTIIRSLNLPDNQLTQCVLASNNRHRINPNLPQGYFGNFISPIKTTTTVSELLRHNLGWSASLINQSVKNQSDKVVRQFYNRWMESPFFSKPDMMANGCNVLMTSSPRFDVYGNEFGLGKAICVRSGYGNKSIGRVTSYPGYEGNGSVDLEICLPPESMSVLELDEEFKNFVEKSECKWN